MTALLALTLVLMAPVPAPVPLQWKLAKGDTFYSKTTMSLHQTMTFSGQEKEHDQNQTTFHKFKVLAADAKGYRIEQTVEKTAVKTQLPGAEAAAEKMQGAVLIYTLDEKFAVKKMEGLDKILDKLAGDDEAARKTLGAMLTEEIFSAAFSEVFRTAPDSPVKPGGKWSRDYAMPLGGGLGALKVESKYKYVETGDSGDKITWTAETKYEPSKADSGLPFKIVGGELKSEEFTGQFLFDSPRGRIKTASTKAKIAGTLTMSVQGTEVEMGIKQVIESTTTITDKSLVEK